MITVPVDLEHHEHTDKIMLAYSIGSAETPHGKLDVLASGRLVRFELAGHDGYVTVDLSEIAGVAVEILTGIREGGSDEDAEVQS